MASLLDETAPVSSQVRRLLQAHWREAPDMLRVAGWLACEERTLRRRLTEEQTSFRALKDEIRSEVAIQQLRHTANSISDIAQALGFSDAANFRKAFMRWTGRYPSDYRR
jgi:AraC-like DNA-binding protein